MAKNGEFGSKSGKFMPKSVKSWLCSLTQTTLPLQYHYITKQMKRKQTNENLF
jgi:hypothetical protein